KQMQPMGLQHRLAGAPPAQHAEAGITQQRERAEQQPERPPGARRLPLLPLPQPSGLRQPIHCRQLAAVALAQARALPPVGVDHQPLPPMAVGGDDSLSYLELLRRLQAAAPAGDPARRCRLLPVPPRLFFSLAAPLLLLSPKRFEAVLRMGADLAGFSPAHALSGEDAQAFPVLPLAP
ncbi:MAG: hypothetical protein ACKOPN_01740, partial [Prochlorococcaceae cyanobacterium]